MNRKLLHASPVAAAALAGTLLLTGATSQSCAPDAATTASGDTSAHSTSASTAQVYARTQLGRHGWGSSQMGCLKKLWNQESGWNDRAVNPNSGAAGIPQALGHGHVFDLGDYRAQIRWGLSYIKSRYGSPCSAWTHEVAANWY